MRVFEYVPREEWKPVRREIVEIISSVRKLLKPKFTFSFAFIGSSHRGLITREINGNRGYDFDVDLRVNDEEEKYSADELKHMFMQAFDSISWQYGYRPCEDSKSVITMKRVDEFNSRILYGCDFAIVNNYFDKKGNPRQQYIFFDKENTEYLWFERSKEYCRLKEKEERIKEAGAWSVVRTVYLNKKCRFSYQKKSRALYAETINEVFMSLN